ncbi:MAG: PQQ-binding-like beta-propeller repeat protein, partial [Persicimonas sp.]
GRMVALQLETGEELWESDLTGGKTELMDADEDPIIVGERLYAAGYDGGLYALNRQDGRTIWHQPMRGVADFELGGSELYVASSTSRVLALDLEDGEPRWSFRLDDSIPVAVSPTESYLFVSTSQGPLYTLDRETGYPMRKWSPSTGFNTRVIVGEKQLYAFSNRGYLYGFRVAH